MIKNLKSQWSLMGKERMFVLIGGIASLLFIGLNYKKLNITEIAFFLLLFFIPSVLFSIIRNRNELKIQSEESKNLLEYVEGLEKVLEDNLINQHENKNQLVAIHGLILQKEFDSALDYIEGIGSSENEQTRQYKRLSPLPTGGLKGILHTVWLDFLKDEIEVKIQLSGEFKNITQKELGDELYFDICSALYIIFGKSRRVGLKINERTLLCHFKADQNALEGKIKIEFENNKEIEQAIKSVLNEKIESKNEKILKKIKKAHSNSISTEEILDNTGFQLSLIAKKNN